MLVGHQRAGQSTSGETLAGYDGAVLDRGPEVSIDVDHVAGDVVAGEIRNVVGGNDPKRSVEALRNSRIAQQLGELGGPRRAAMRAAGAHQDTKDIGSDS